MKINKAPRVAALSLVAAFACTKAENVNAITCDGTNTTDFKAVSFDLEAPTELIPFPRAYFTIENIGTNPNRDRLYFDIYEVDENQNELAYIKMVYNDNTVPPGGQLLRAITFTPFHMSEGRHYKGVIRYACDPNASNNVLFQTAWGTGGTGPGPSNDNIFKDSFEETPATAMARSFNKYANDNTEVVIEESQHGNGEFSILGYIRPKQPTPKP